ncbi:leucine-rich repeat transmembrane protein kinase protein [Actinidia rufa]|uniref:Leucine-rich repeat transmembrane protein kinase protein n=1 Tax=Actinidia rufa TaxID=165716 RepID=A0A7J0FES3_9ERIC|nr:leucine-rich repeat transmembrane protein kinase protein [Actinidia rufa]
MPVPPPHSSSPPPLPPLSPVAPPRSIIHGWKNSRRTRGRRVCNLRWSWRGPVLQFTEGEGEGECGERSGDRRGLRVYAMVAERSGVPRRPALQQWWLPAAEVHGQIPQDKSGFISIDCGIQEGYTEESTYYSSDANFVDTGINYNVSAEYRAADLDPRLASLRSFPQGTRNCYTLRPEQGKNNSYLIRAWFLYGNYDGQNSFPKFDLYIGVNLWEKIGISNNASYKTEIMYVPSTDIYTRMSVEYSLDAWHPMCGTMWARIEEEISLSASARAANELP